MGKLRIGLRGKATRRVTPSQTAQALGSGDVPVLSTPALVALLETAAVNALTGRLGVGRDHDGNSDRGGPSGGDTPAGLEVRAEAELIAIERSEVDVLLCRL